MGYPSPCKVLLTAYRWHHYLEQQPHPLVLIGCGPQQALGIQGDQVEGGVISSPDTNGAGVGRLGGVEDALPSKQDVVEGVGLAVSGVAEDGQDLDSCHLAAAQPLQELCFITHLGGGGGDSDRREVNK